MGSVADTRIKGWPIQNWNQEQPPPDPGRVDLVEQILDGQRPLILVSMSGPDGQNTSTFFCFGSHQDRQGDLEKTPQRGVFDADVVVTPSGAPNIDRFRESVDSLGFHGNFHSLSLVHETLDNRVCYSPVNRLICAQAMTTRKR